jgi:tRNA (guanine37-N1)-methyltransferase
MRVDVITIFPDLFEPFRRTSLVGRAVEAGLLSIAAHDLRAWSADPHRSVDDEPYGGGGGMVMTAPPWIAAVGAVSAGAEPWRILLSPQGTALTDAKVRELALRPHLLFLCGRYEGIDERVAQTVVDEEISIGDYVLAGGELAAMVVADVVLRKLPGVLGKDESAVEESFSAALEGAPEYPHYTRPADWRGWTVPDVLLSGHHEEIRKWRLEQSRRRAGGPLP